LRQGEPQRRLLELAQEPVQRQVLVLVLVLVQAQGLVPVREQRRRVAQLHHRTLEQP
jgi:hypothetical protein